MATRFAEGEGEGEGEVPLLLAFCTVATVPWSDIYSDRRPNEILCH